MSGGNGDSRAASRSARFSWAIYDWASNGFATVILTFVFSAYFARAVAGNPASGTSLWGTALAVAGVTIAIVAPFAGAMADRGGAVKPWLAAMTALGAMATAALWFVTPDRAAIPLALILIGLANFGLELGFVFYNAMLPRLVPVNRLGRLSGGGMALGYAGGLACLSAVLFGFVRADPLPFGLDPASHEGVRAVGPFVALWIGVFSLPLFLFTPDRARSDLALTQAVRDGLAQMRETLGQIRRYRNLVRFLIARLVYIDGLGTLFAFGGIYAATAFGMSMEEVLIFGIVLNVTAGIGAFAFGWIDDRIGAKPTILIALAGLVAFGIPLLVVDQKPLLWSIAVPLGLFIGPAQSASRSLMARLAPPRLETQMFGFFALSGKVTAFAGPALVALITAWTGSQRVGLSIIIVLFIAGGALLLGVEEKPER